MASDPGTKSLASTLESSIHLKMLKPPSLYTKIAISKFSVKRSNFNLLIETMSTLHKQAMQIEVTTANDQVVKVRLVKGKPVADTDALR